MADSFHARFSAIKREYNYYIINNYSTSKRFYTWYCKWPLKYEKLIECSKILIGKHDFSLLSKASSNTKNKVCNIYKSEWIKENDKLIYNIQANRFLQHMVRLLVGTMVEVSRKKIRFEKFKELIENPSENAKIFKAPPQGLVLYKVDYANN